MMRTVFLVLATLLCGSVAVGSQRVFTFEPCVPPQDAEYHTYDMGSAMIQVNANGQGGRINWNFCAPTQAALLHVKKIRIAFSDDSNDSVMATHDVDICNTGGSDCLAQLRARTNPSCVYGSKTLTWLHLPHSNASGKISLIEPGNGEVIVAEFCSV
jgi:hypothetical protein